ncbi:hypothetical protein [uncultured Winogradskyella sp.]|uniref:hypothetical protein n=1 Tax=uncultured Winogradskyella sp. TaxID=395353 RepID=UPI00261AA767|nr:hypothetical protein [uncultured Winogradskyella sp.]
MKKIILFVAAIFLLNGCSFFENEETKEQLVEKDKINLNKEVSTNKALLYKFIKVSFKFSYCEENEAQRVIESHPEVNDMYEGASALMEILDKSIDDNGNKKELSVIDYINIYRNFTKTKNATTDFDEDVLPSFFQSTNPELRAKEEESQKIKALEHGVFACLSLALKSLAQPICFYELSKIEPEALPEEAYKINLITARNIMLFVKGLYYLSEYELTENIDWINANPDVDFKGLYYIPSHLKPTLGGKERTIILIHNYILRGLDRLKMDDEASEKEALKDFETTIKIAEEAQIENEIIQAVATYFYLKNEDSEKAIYSLKKLKTSKILLSREKKSIDEAIIYLEKRESGKVLNGIYDKGFLGKIVISYIFAQAKEVDWEKVLKENGIEIPEEVTENFAIIEDLVSKLNEYSDEEAIQNTKEAVKNKGLDLWEKSKNILE